MRARFVLAAATLVVAATVAGCARNSAPPLAPSIPRVAGAVRTPYAFRYVEVAEGTGAPALHSHCLYAHYTGWLAADGSKFDSSRDTTAAGAPREPIAFPQGARRVIAGWDAGFEGMRVGGRRRFIIPYQLAYGERGRPPRIPPRSTLVFDVELMAVADTLPRADTTGVRVAAGPTWPACPAWADVKGTAAAAR
jgi:peptidylprolyl isomerase